MIKRILVLTLTAGLGLTACAQPNMNSSVYSPSSAMRAQLVQTGTIIDMRTVEIRSVRGEADRAAGVVVGGVLGAMAGDKLGDGNAVATGAGAIAGAFGGDALARGVNRTAAQEWTIRLDNGQTIAIVQTDPGLRVGQYVRVITDGATTRIVR